MSTEKQNILKRIKRALERPVPLPFPNAEQQQQMFPHTDEDLTVIFAEEFTRLQGKFGFFNDFDQLALELIELIRKNEWKEVYCAEQGLRILLNKNGFNEFSSKTLSYSDVAITTCESLVARTGTMVMSAALPEGRTASVYAPVHVCIAETSQLVFDVEDAIQMIKEKYGSHIPSQICFATGPSRTADIEKTLVVGVHGPKEVYCLLADK